MAQNDFETGPSGEFTEPDIDSSIPVITGAMSVDEILSHLAGHNCSDVTGDIDPSQCSQLAISTGGFGDVYRGRLFDGTRVALKCLRVLIGFNNEGQKQLKRAAHELYVWSRCKHPNVLGLIGVAKYRDQIAMVSPWMDNGHLAWFLSQQPQVDRYEICVQITDGIAYLHSQGIVYGDMKGANILVSQDNTVKLTDFGSATMKEYTLQFTTTQTMSSMSLRWTAPEIVMGETGHTSEGDIYALGMASLCVDTMLEVITGLPPYAEARVEQAVMWKIMSKTLPQRPEELIPSLNDNQADLLWALLTSCWKHDPPARPTAAEAQSQLRAIDPERFKRPTRGASGEEPMAEEQAMHKEPPVTLDNSHKNLTEDGSQNPPESPVSGPLVINFPTTNRTRSLPTDTNHLLPPVGAPSSRESTAENAAPLSDGRRITPARKTFFNRQLLVNNLPAQCESADLKDLFRSAGQVRRAEVAVGSDGRSIGVGTVLFARESDSARAVSMFNGYIYNGRVLQVFHANDDRPLDWFGSFPQVSV
ncbi:hypothetical protein CTheo_3351 [Ceratobasidium theobromae]|uniref:Uncharacterized protein n=1 Tax=Ceratobasidium theobromae TaxID=1582974 RepID=A0A5N5QNM4_9AGAM|nr:hypothetical protein CTheo_3351 [Ceratobasidium theobromae]